MTQEQKAQAFLDEYKALTVKHGFALRPVIKPDFQIIVLEQSDKTPVEAPETTQVDINPAPSDSE